MFQSSERRVDLDLPRAKQYKLPFPKNLVEERGVPIKRISFVHRIAVETAAVSERMGFDVTIDQCGSRVSRGGQLWSLGTHPRSRSSAKWVDRERKYTKGASASSPAIRPTRRPKSSSIKLRSASRNGDWPPIADGVYVLLRADSGEGPSKLCINASFDWSATLPFAPMHHEH